MSDLNAASIVPSNCYRSFNAEHVPNPLDTCNRCQQIAYMNDFGNFPAQEQACRDVCGEWFRMGCPAQTVAPPQSKY